MKIYVKELFLLLALLFAPSLLFAQMTIDELEPTKQENVRFRDTVKRVTIEDPEYYSEARYRAERAALRQERNTLEIISSLQGSLTAYNDPWVSTSGGDNTTAILGSFTLNHSYKRDKLTVTSKVSANFGYNRVKIDVTDSEGETSSEGVWYKNQDEISISVAPTIAISSIWSYGPTLTFRTQFADGYVSRSQQNSYELKSGFMSPGYLSISGAMTYKSPNSKLPFTVSIAPAALSATYVSSEYIMNNFLYQFLEHDDDNYTYTEPYGLSPSSKSKYEGGSSLQIDFDRTFEKLGSIRYTTTIYSFYGWMTQISYKNIINDYDQYVDDLAAWNADNSIGVKPMLGIQPTVRWENTISIPTTKFISTTLKFQMYYNRAQNLKIQTQTYLSLGLSYTYKNK